MFRNFSRGEFERLTENCGGNAQEKSCTNSWPTKHKIFLLRSTCASSSRSLSVEDVTLSYCNLIAHFFYASSFSSLSPRSIVYAPSRVCWEYSFPHPKQLADMSQPDLVKTVKDTWVVARDSFQNSFQAGCNAWATHVEPKAREIERSLKQKVGDAQRFLKKKATHFSKQEKSPSA